MATKKKTAPAPAESNGDGAMTKAEFLKHAEPLKVTINGREYEAEVYEFSTGSVGFRLDEKVMVTVGGRRVQLKFQANVTATGSKEWAS